MNCEETYDRLVAMKNHALATLEQRQLTAHLVSCEVCQSTARSSVALQEIRDQELQSVPDGLFENVMRHTVRTAKPAGSRFWMGAGFGGALAASIMLVVMSFGFGTGASPVTADVIQFQVSIHESRDLNVAIDLERSLPGATITVVLTGGIEIDGFGSQRKITWTSDLQAGVNRLTLPIVAINEAGGQLLVTVNHENKQRTFQVKLTLDT